MNWTLRYLWPMRRLSVRAPSPRRGSASARRHWRGCFTNQPETGLRRIRGFSLFAMDGTTLRTADSAANRRHFGASAAAHGRIGSYPQLRAVTLTALATHLVRDAVFGPYNINEMVSARELIPRVPANSITVFDRGFMSAQLLCNLVSGGENRHYIIPAKSNLRCEFVNERDGDRIVRMRVSPQARAKCPELPESWQARRARRGCQWAATDAADVPD
ncbi:hypothetical protein OKW40_005453 [Paraburkholderia sp. RAU6.4a]